MDRRRDDHRLDNRSRDARESQTTRNVTLAESQAERGPDRQVVRIERRDLGRNESTPSNGSDGNDWKADREKYQNSLVAEGTVRDYGKRDDRARNFPATNVRDLRPHVDFKHRNEGGNNNFRRGPDNNNNDSTRPINRKPITPLKPIDRKKRCPFLMRVFLSHNNHNEIASYEKGAVPKEELAIYTWPDAKLKEVAQLIKESYPDADKPDSTLKFSRVFPDPKTGAWQLVEVGKIGARVGNDDFQNIHDLGFLIGDYMDVAIVNNRK